MDELNKINAYTFETLGNMLFKIVPEYETILISDLYTTIGNYIFMNGFATALANEIKKDSSSVFVQNAFKYINTIGESNNLEVLNILQVGILEILYTSGEMVRNRTEEQIKSDKIKFIFQNFARFYR